MEISTALEETLAQAGTMHRILERAVHDRGASWSIEVDGAHWCFVQPTLTETGIEFVADYAGFEEGRYMIYLLCDGEKMRATEMTLCADEDGSMVHAWRFRIHTANTSRGVS